MALIARVGAAIALADEATKGVLQDALAALVEDHGLLATLERRRSADRERKRPTVEHASPCKNSAESTESASVSEFQSGSPLSPQVSLLSPTPPNNPSFPPLSPPRETGGARDYPPDFCAAWERYPRRAGGNSKREAFRAWSARITQGTTAEELAAGVERYRAFIEATGREGTEYVMQTATFFGPNERWRETWLPPEVRGPSAAKSSSPENGEAGRVFAAIRALVRETPNPGRGMIRMIPKADVAALGDAALRAYEQIGGADRFLDPDEKIGFVLRDFAAAYTASTRNGSHG